MKTLDLNSYNVQEMNTEEMKTTEGGFLLEALFLFLVGLALGLATEQ